MSAAVETTPDLAAKLQRCRSALNELGRVIVAFSGGVDSSFLLALACDTLGTDNVLAAMAVSTIFPQHDRASGKQFASQLGVEMLEIQTPQLADPSFTSNPADRCYYCKTQLMSKLKGLAAQRGMNAVISGANVDDAGDYRPGSRAEEQLGIRRPLVEAGLTKSDIRQASKALNLPTWNMASMACLATRVPYGQPITEEKLLRIGQSENALRELGFEQCRVRDHGDVARVEVPADRLQRAMDSRQRIIDALKAAGYLFVALDLEGFRTGSMNRTIGK